MAPSRASTRVNQAPTRYGDEEEVHTSHSSTRKSSKASKGSAKHVTKKISTKSKITRKPAKASQKKTSSTSKGINPKLPSWFLIPIAKRNESRHHTVNSDSEISGIIEIVNISCSKSSSPMPILNPLSRIVTIVQVYKERRTHATPKQVVMDLACPFLSFKTKLFGIVATKLGANYELDPADVTYRFLWGAAKLPANKKLVGTPLDLEDDGDFDGLQTAIQNTASKKSGTSDKVLYIHAIVPNREENALDPPNALDSPRRQVIFLNISFC